MRQAFDSDACADGEEAAKRAIYFGDATTFRSVVFLLKEQAAIGTLSCDGN